ncbi:unnamed protein product [Schistosoma mattheei]|uniref:Uncharacterized protein n=1 Tax=Schistosoma mattheei TaxID=31246 RepID=A0A183Q739_9TREM|nr:unnamed protein product [Schistosoma mattheei]
MTGARNSYLSLGLRIQLINCLANGAIPVFIGNNDIYSDEAINSELLSKVIIHVPRPRVEELPALLQSLPEAHIVEIRRQVSSTIKKLFKLKSIISLFILFSFCFTSSTSYRIVYVSHINY